VVGKYSVVATVALDVFDQNKTVFTTGRDAAVGVVGFVTGPFGAFGAGVYFILRNVQMRYLIWKSRMGHGQYFFLCGELLKDRQMAVRKRSISASSMTSACRTEPRMRSFESSEFVQKCGFD
jgi:hypothetical protein